MVTYPKAQFKYNIIHNDAPHATYIHVGHATYIHIGKTGNQEFYVRTDKRNNFAIIYIAQCWAINGIMYLV